MPISSIVWIWENWDSHWFHVERPKISPPETDVGKLFLSVLWLLYIPPVQQTGHRVAPLRVTVAVNHPLIWVGCNTCTQHSELLRVETSVLGHSCSGGLQNGRPPLSLSSLLLPSTVTTSFLPFDHYKSECHWHWQWSGSSESKDLSFAHIVLFACSAIWLRL